MTIATLADIRSKVRRLTGAIDTSQLTDSQIDDYINSFYLYDLPAQFRSLQLKDVYSFLTTRGISTYSFNQNTYIDVKGPVYLDKQEIALFFNEKEFFAYYPSDMYVETFATGDGTAGPFSGTLNNTTIVRSVNNDFTSASYPSARVVNFFISANSSLGDTQILTDGTSSGASGTLRPENASTASGTINYGTGALSGVTFPNAVPSGESIEAHYLALTLAKPNSLLYLQNQLTISPPPDKGYLIELTVYRRPTDVLLASSANNPELNEWWELVSAGAAKKIYEDRSDEEGIANMMRLLMERYSIAETRTYAQLGEQRVPSIFSSQTPNINSFFIGL